MIKPWEWFRRRSGRMPKEDDRLAYDLESEMMARKCPPQDIEGLSVLIIDDNEALLQTMSSFLRRKGAATDTASDGESGLSMYLKGRYSYGMIFVDVQMSGMDGYEVIRHIRREEQAAGSAKVPIVLMTGKATEDTARDAPYNYMLRKPFDYETLPHIIANLLTQENQDTKEK